LGKQRRGGGQREQGGEQAFDHGSAYALNCGSAKAAR
jgi:hypothetical protein